MTSANSKKVPIFLGIFFRGNFFCFSVWGTVPCYLLHFGTKACTLLQDMCYFYSAFLNDPNTGYQLCTCRLAVCYRTQQQQYLYAASAAYSTLQYFAVYLISSCCRLLQKSRSSQEFEDLATGLYIYIFPHGWKSTSIMPRHLRWVVLKDQQSAPLEIPAHSCLRWDAHKISVGQISCGPGTTCL